MGNVYTTPFVRTGLINPPAGTTELFSAFDASFQYVIRDVLLSVIPGVPTATAGVYVDGAAGGAYPILDSGFVGAGAQLLHFDGRVPMFTGERCNLVIGGTDPLICTVIVGGFRLSLP